jgi:hypothetical protein
MAAHGLLLTAIALTLHYAWEVIQCPIFFVHPDGDVGSLAMLRATTGDLGATWLVQLSLALVTRRWTWSLEQWGVREWVLIEGLAIAMSVSVEFWALGSGQWSYTDGSPRFPGTPISVVPVAQFMILIPATFLLSKRLLRALLFRG